MQIHEKRRDRRSGQEPGTGSGGALSSPGISNDALISLWGEGETSGRPGLEEDILARQPGMHVQPQIPQAEQEADRLSAAVSSGSPEAVKADMGRRMGADFSAVRFHTDAAAAQMAESAGARAFTAGGDVYFGDGGFDPAVAAHELVHTVQQGAVESGTATMSTPMGGIQREEDTSKKKRSGLFSRIRRHFGADTRAARELSDEMRQRDEAFKAQETDEAARKNWEGLNMEADPRLEEMTVQLTPLFEHMLAFKKSYAAHGYSTVQQDRVAQFNSNLKNTKQASHKVNQKKRQITDYQKIIAEAQASPDKTSRIKIQMATEKIRALTEEIAGIEENVRRMFQVREFSREETEKYVRSKNPKLQGADLEAEVERAMARNQADRAIADSFSRMYHDPSLPPDAILDTSTEVRTRPTDLSSRETKSNSVGKGYGRAAMMGGDFRPTMEFGHAFAPVADLPVKPLPMRRTTETEENARLAGQKFDSLEQEAQTDVLGPAPRMDPVGPVRLPEIDLVGPLGPAPKMDAVGPQLPPQPDLVGPMGLPPRMDPVAPQPLPPEEMIGPMERPPVMAPVGPLLPEKKKPAPEPNAPAQPAAASAAAPPEKKRSKWDRLKFWKRSRSSEDDEEINFSTSGPVMSEEARRQFAEQMKALADSDQRVAANSGPAQDVDIDPTNVVHYGTSGSRAGSRTQHIEQTRKLMQEAGEDPDQRHTTVDELNRTIGLVPDIFENLGIYRKELQKKVAKAEGGADTPAHQEATAWREWLSEPSRMDALMMGEMDTNQFLVDQRLDEDTDERKDAAAYEQKSMDSDQLSHDINSGQVDPETGKAITWKQEAHKANQERELGAQYVFWTPALRQATAAMANAPDLGKKSEAESDVKEASMDAAAQAQAAGREVSPEAGKQWGQRILENFMRWMSVVQGRFWRLTSLMGLDFFASRKKQILFTRADPNAPDFKGAASRRRRMITDSEWRHVREMGYEKSGAVKRLGANDVLKDKRKTGAST